MLKAERDQLMSSLSPQERKAFRGAIERIREVRTATTSRGVSVREIANSLGDSVPARVLQSLGGVAVRDEMGPRVDEVPPDFCLKRMGSEERVRLSSFQGERPVALAFGSYT